MAEMEVLCGRLCLLTRAAWREGLPEPLSRKTVHRMLCTGALRGLTLCRVPQIESDIYQRAEALLSRASEIGLLLEQWHLKGFDACLPSDDDRLINLQALVEEMPLFLFLCGNRKLLLRRSVALAGSRQIARATQESATRFGMHLAREGYVMVSGGAHGVDECAQRGLLEQGGSLILVPAVPVPRLLKNALLLQALAEGRLLLVCDTWPDENFSAYKALKRNASIYALGDAAVALAARKEKGGTWNGAVTCLKNQCTPLFTPLLQGEDFDGNRALLERGARPLDLNQSLRIQLFGEEEKTRAD